ncbi:MAG TPA: hypothetical protein VJH65_01440 [Candidatus Nanoarchaeia archaeon]|nr:hypothetical protein [Candidatus Nanoarchaeia archaeon]
MFNKKEIATIVIVSLIIGLIISWVKSIQIFFYSFLAIFFAIIINALTKKIASFYLDVETEIELWEIKKYGYKYYQRFKKPFPAGALLPIIIKIFSFGYLNWLASLVFEVKPKVYRAAKRHGLYTFSEMTEYHLGLIAAAGIISNLFFAILGYLVGLNDFAKLNFYYAFFNMIPISDLDGNKIFFGNLMLWIFLVCIIVIGLLFTIFVI